MIDSQVTTLVVAGLAVRLDLLAAPAARQSMITERYAAFLDPAPGVAPVATLYLQEVAGADFLAWAENAPLPVRVRLVGERLWVRSPWECGWLDLASRVGVITLRPRGDPENFLRVVYAWLCLQRGGLLLHACGLRVGERGYLFAGPSGAGKSTVAALSTGATVLSDDLVAVRPVGGRYHLYGTPFFGSSATAPRADGCVPLAGFYLLVQALHHALAPLTPAAALAQVVAATPFITTLPAGASLTLGVCARLVAQTSPQALHFRPDPGFWEVIHASCNGNAAYPPAGGGAHLGWSRHCGAGRRG